MTFVIALNDFDESCQPKPGNQHFSKEEGYETIDLQPPFIRDYDQWGIRFDWEVDLHWSPEGHTFVAEQIRTSNAFGELFNS